LGLGDPNDCETFVTLKYATTPDEKLKRIAERTE
jgi:hypothetical protein